MSPLRWILLALALSVSSSTHAVVYCIATSTELNQAFSLANLADEGTTHELRLRPGNYTATSGLAFFPAGDKDNKEFYLTGGWNTGCSARVINPALTTINATSDAFEFRGNNRRFVIEGIRFFNFSTFIVDDFACGAFDCPDTEEIRLRFNDIRDGGVLAVIGQESDSLRVTNNLVANLLNQNGSVLLSYANTESPPVIAFNTFAGLSCGTSASAVGLSSELAGATVHHNIFESSCTSDVEILASGGQPMALRNNLYQTRTGLAPSASSGNVISNDPGFVNVAGGDFRLREAPTISPAANGGMTAIQAASFGLSGVIPAQDLDGPSGLRLVGTRYDIGAFESSINDASTLTVSKTADTNDGVCNSDCSLREAIAASNGAANTQRIEFNIPGACPRLLQISSPLPDIVDSVEIDGFSQPGATANTAAVGSDAELCVILASQSETLAQAMQVPIAAPNDTSLTLRGLAIAGSTGFNGNFTVALRLRGGSDHLIQGNAFAGTGPGSIGPLGFLNFGIQVRDNAQNVLIGGAEPEHRNSFGAMLSSAIVFNDATSSGHTVQNNYIGLTASGNSASEIELNGIFASNSPNLSILDNTFATIPNNAALSIQGATATGYLIARNQFGTAASGIPTAALRNATAISFAGGTGDHIVGSPTGSGNANVITNSKAAGVHITASAGTGIVVRPNRIFDNGKEGPGLGIDIGTLGQSVNDPNDTDTGANNGQNFPQISASLPNADGTRAVTVSLNSVANQSYRVDVYRSPDCPAGDRGANLLNRIGTVLVNSNGSGNGSSTFNVTGNGAPGILSAIATRISTGDTSEPSLCYLEPNATTTTITSDAPDPSQFGQPYLVSVLVISPSGTPGGTVNVSDGDGNQCQVTLNGTGAGSCQLPSASVGTTTLTASYTGSLLYAPSSGTATHTVVAAPTTTTIVSDNPDPSEVGQPYTVAVQVRPPTGNQALVQGTVAVSDGTGQTCAINLTGGGDGSCQLTSVSAGSKTLNATFAGLPNFSGSSDTESHTVVPMATTTTIVSDNPDPSAVGQTYIVVAAVASNSGFATPTGSVAVSDGTGSTCNITLNQGGGNCQLTSTTAGNKTLTAIYTSNSQAFATSSDTEPHAVGIAATTTAIAATTPNPSRVGEPFLVEMTVTSAAVPVDGTVSVNAGLGGPTCQATISNGSGSCQMTVGVSGVSLLTACYVPGPGFSGSCGNANHQTLKADTNLNFGPFVPANPVQNAAVQVTAVLGIVAPGAGAPSGTITASVVGGSDSCAIILPAGSCNLPLSIAGPVNVQLSYPGDANFNPSSRITTLQVTPDQLFRNGFE